MRVVERCSADGRRLRFGAAASAAVCVTEYRKKVLIL